MKVKFCGAAGVVTGSSHLLELKSGYKILLDCGLYQGRDEDFSKFNEEWLYDPSEIDCMILSHAHIDHGGRIPKLVKDGYEGDIICTSATRDLSAIMLIDSGFIHEQEAAFNRKKKIKGAPTEPLYTVEDARDSMTQFIGISYNRWFKINDEVSVLFKDAGHILGSASVTLKIKDDEYHDTYFGFSGDIGRPDRPILKDPQAMPELDYLICESTYGGREHSGQPQDEQALLDVIKNTCVEKKGKLIIPAFSVGRTQEIVYMLDKLETAGKLPNIKVYVDSPLAINATEIFVMHPECYDKELTRFMSIDPTPFGFKNLHTTRSAEESKKLNDLDEPCIIISASGMMQAGRIKHHLLNNIDDDKNTILVVGFCSPGTLGAYIRTKPEKVKIYGTEKEVKADIQIMDSFSAHADQSEILEFLNKLNKKKLKKIFLVHGDPKRQELLKEAILEDNFKDVFIPKLGETVKL